MEYTDNKIKPIIAVTSDDRAKEKNIYNFISCEITSGWLLKGENQIERSLESFKKLKLKR